MNLKLRFFSMVVIAIGLNQVNIAYAQQYDQPISDKKKLLSSKLAVEKYPDSVQLHKAYLDNMGILNPDVTKQYDIWIKKFPQSALVPLVIGDTLASIEDPKARKYLLASLKVNPKIARTYYKLAFDADRWGDSKAYSDYLAMATKLEPENPSYAFYYASSLYKLDPQKWKNESINVALRFKNHQRGRQAMFILANKSVNQFEKAYYLQWLHDDFDPSSSWYRVGMETYYDVLLELNLDKALTLAKEMAARPQYAKAWETKVKNANLLIEARAHFGTDAKKTIEILNSVSASPNDKKLAIKLLLLKADAFDKIGQPEKGYAEMISYLLKMPSKYLRQQITQLGQKLNKKDVQVKQDIRDSLYRNAQLATEFRLNTYLTKGQASLSGYKGKAVLLTYWFPGCGPCRAEFPHFENVIKKYQSDEVAYLAINIDQRQNEYVIPFMEKTKYSFTPLEETVGRKKGNLDNGRSAPVNFMIDKEGKLIFSKFRIDEANEDELEMMFDLALGK